MTMKYKMATLVACLLLATGFMPLAVQAQTCLSSITATTPASDFTINGDGTATHSKTGLMWQQCSEGQTYSDGGCSGTASTFTWAEALQRAAAVNAGTIGEQHGYSNWRLPNKNELSSIVEESCYNPSINATVFPNTGSGYYFSSSQGAHYWSTGRNPAAIVWCVTFDYGGVVDTTTGGAIVYVPGWHLGYDVRLVRGGQPLNLPDTLAPTVTSFAIPATGTSATVTITTLSATDNVAVTQWCITETDSSAGCSWSDTQPADYTFTFIPTGNPTPKTLYAWAKDAAGNVSAPVSATTTIFDTEPPAVTAFAIQVTGTSATVTISTLTATDNVIVAQWCTTETNSTAGCSWSDTQPTVYTFTGIPTGTPTAKTLYVWAKDAAGNVSAPVSVATTIFDTVAPTVTAFAIPATGTSVTVAITTLSATDNAAVTQWCTTETNSSAGCSWSDTQPTDYYFIGLRAGTPTPKTLYAWAKDAAGNVSASVSAATTITPTTVNCDTVDSNLNVDIPCINAGGEYYRVKLNRYQNPADPFGFYWSLGEVALTAGNDGYCDSVYDNGYYAESVHIPNMMVIMSCVAVNGVEYYVELNQYVNTADPSQFYWWLGTAVQIRP